MARYLANLTNGPIDEKGFLRALGVLLTGSGVSQAASMTVAAQDTPDMTVKVAGGTTGHDIVFITTAGDTYHGWNTASENVTITANASGVTKKDAIVAYADLAAGIATSNNPGALKLIAVRGAGTDTAPDNTQIMASTVGSNPYVVLAHVTVANGVGSINSGNITDQRTTTQISKEVIEPIGTDQIASEAWTSFTPTWTATSTAPSIGNGTRVGRYIKRGRDIKGSIKFVMGSTTNFGTGVYFFGIPEAIANQGVGYGGMSIVTDFGTKNYPFLPLIETGNSLFSLINTSTGAQLQHNNPFTWAPGDIIQISFWGETAA